jgi:CRP-like cAMP-binding protein
MSSGQRPEIRSLKEREYLVRQGDPGDSLFLLLDGVLSVTIDGETVAEVGPGVVLGERAVLEGGIRTASLQAATPVRIAVAPADRIDRDALVQLRENRLPKARSPRSSVTSSGCVSPLGT